MVNIRQEHLVARAEMFRFQNLIRNSMEEVSQKRMEGIFLSNDDAFLITCANLLNAGFDLHPDDLARIDGLKKEQEVTVNQFV